jgi:flagellar hook assembly protein FlgD
MRAESSKGAFSQMLTPEDLDKEFKFLTNLIIEDFRDPDPTKEKDHTQQTLAMITMMSAGSQMQMSSNLQDLLRHMKQQSQMVIESRIGKKVQYRGDPVFEVASNDKTVPIRYRLGKDAAMGMARIYNDQGQLVHEIPLTKLTKGDHQITWDRLVKGSNRPIPEGMYTVDFNLMGRDGKKFNDGDYLFELEGVVSGIDRDDDGSPIYYVGGHPISGRITTISKASGEFEQLSSWFKDGPLTQLTSSKPINTPVQPRTLAVDSQMQNPLADASRAMQQASSVPPVIDQLI